MKGVTSGTLRWVLLLAPFEFLPRVLDDWIRNHRTQIATSFANLLTVRTKNTFYAVDMSVDGVEVNEPNSRDRELKLKRLAAAALAKVEGLIGRRRRRSRQDEHSVLVRASGAALKRAAYRRPLHGDPTIPAPHSAASFRIRHRKGGFGEERSGRKDS